MRERLPLALVLIPAVILLTGFFALDYSWIRQVQSAATRTPAPASGAPTSATTPASTPAVVRAKVEIVWPHEGARVEDADLANITAFLLAGDGAQGARPALDPPPCDWAPTVQLWRALNNQPARLVGVGEKRMVTGGGRSFPAWDFNDVDVNEARDPANKLSFFVTVENAGSPVRALRNVWVHAVDARTLFPQQDVPTSVARVRPRALDAKIQIVWPHDNLSVQQAQRANITAYLFTAGAQRALAPDITRATGWSPTVRLHTSLNNEPEAAPGTGVVGVSRVITGTNGIRFLAWDFNDVDVSLANDRLNRLNFWVSVDGVSTDSNIWVHGADARTLFPQPDVLNSCK